MNKTFRLLGLVAIGIAAFGTMVPNSVQAQTTIGLQPYSLFSTATTNSGVNPSYAVVGAHATTFLNGQPVLGTPVVTHLNASSDKLGSKVSFYRVTAMTQCAYQTNGTVTLSVFQTNGFSAADVIVIRHISDDSYEKRILTTMGAATNLITTVAPWSAVIPGDIIYRVQSAGSGAIPLVTNTVAANTMSLDIAGTALHVGQRGMPLLLEVDQTTASGSINDVTVRFEP